MMTKRMSRRVRLEKEAEESSRWWEQWGGADCPECGAPMEHAKGYVGEVIVFCKGCGVASEEPVTLAMIE